MENSKGYTDDKMIDSGNSNKLDYPEFWFYWNPNANFSQNIESLLTSIAIEKMEFITNINMPKPPLHHRKFTINQYY